MKKQYLIISLISLSVLLTGVMCGFTGSGAPAQSPTQPPAAVQAPTQDSAQPPAAVSPTQAPAQAAPAAANPPAAPASVDVKVLAQQKCSECHSYNKSIRFRGDTAGWTQVVDVMIQQGAQITPEEEKTIVKYFAATYK